MLRPMKTLSRMLGISLLSLSLTGCAAEEESAQVGAEIMVAEEAMTDAYVACEATVATSMHQSVIDAGTQDDASCIAAATDLSGCITKKDCTKLLGGDVGVSVCENKVASFNTACGVVLDFSYEVTQ